MQYILLIVLWSLWCFLHSFIISPSVTTYLKEKLQKSYKYFRISYNVFALASFVTVWIYSRSITDTIILNSNPIIFYIQLIIFIVSILIFIFGTKNYDMRQFLGISQLKETNGGQGIGQFGKFNQSGILQYTRHPWYLASILLLWSSFQDLTISRLILNIVFTIYLVIGTFLEERKMVLEFGDSYREYQKKVPMFFSFKKFIK